MAAQSLTRHYQKPWQLIVSVCLTRQNMLTKELSEIEKRYSQMIEEMEFEGSVLNNYEARKRDLEAVATALKSTKMTEKEEEKMTEASRLLASMQDREDMWASDASKIIISPKRQKGDKNKRSIHRMMDSTLHMVIKDDKLLNQQTAVLPYTVLNEGENLRQASERLLDSHGIHDNNTLFLSNAPVGVVKIRFQENEERGQLYQGAKVFFTKAQLTNLEQHNTNDGGGSHEWLSIKEIELECQNDYFERIKKFV